MSRTFVRVRHKFFFLGLLSLINGYFITDTTVKRKNNLHFIWEKNYIFIPYYYTNCTCYYSVFAVYDVSFDNNQNKIYNSTAGIKIINMYLFIRQSRMVGEMVKMYYYCGQHCPGSSCQ